MNTTMLAEPEIDAAVVAPPKPSTLEATGLSPDTISSIIIKMLHGGEATGMGLSDRLCLPYGVFEPLLENLRVEQLVEVKKAHGTGTAGYRYAITDAGRDRANRFFEACGYVGPAPIPVHQYAAHMALLRAQTYEISRDHVAKGFSHLVVEPEMLDQLGPAIASRRAVFLYGAPGNGKSVMGEGIGRVLGGDVYIPYALDVDGQIITMYDPVTHLARPTDDEGSVIRSDNATDRRWIRVARPVITVGGELTLEMLDLRYSNLSAFYEAPVHLKANGGVLVVDDFGRQRVPARDLLNRWIVPLESRVDYMNLHTGRKFQVPFDVMVVFATNLEPRSLADEAFLRRIPYKILAKNPTLAQFEQIFQMNCRRYGLEFDRSTLQHLHDKYYTGRKLDMRACHPRDLIDQIVHLCRYQQRTAEITPELLDAVCQSYFLEDTQTGMTAAR
jgi:DNA-binding PadR family transcriptional regulator